MIKTTQLSKKYGQIAVLHIDALEIPTGQILVWWAIMAQEKLLFLTHC